MATAADILATDDELLTLDEVAAKLKVSVETARKLCVTGRLPWVHAGTGSARQTRRVLKSTLAAFMRDERRETVREEMQSIKRTFAGMKLADERW